MPATELTQKVGYCTISSVSMLHRKKKGGNGKKNALKKAIVTNINTWTISVNISIIHGDPKRLAFCMIFASHVNKPGQMYEKVTRKITGFAILLCLSVGRIYFSLSFIAIKWKSEISLRCDIIFQA